jgi:hypothetical protein
VKVQQATPEEVARMEKGPSARADVEVPNPMLLEIKLVKIGNRPSPLELKAGETWFSTETAPYVCDRARVQRVAVTRIDRRKKATRFRAEAMITSGWYRQDIDLTMTVQTASGRILGKQVWDDLTIGNARGPYSGSTKVPKVEFYVPDDQLESTFAGEEPAVMKLLIEIQGEDGDSDDD